MSQVPARDLAADSLTQESVVEYLQRHPDFFERQPQLLSRLNLPHERGGAAVSLVERQVQVLRDKNQTLDGKLREFFDVARGNDELVDKIHRLSCRLIKARGAVQIIDALEESLRQDFDANEWLIVITRTDVPELARLEHRHLRVAPRGASELRSFDTFFESAKPRCGQIRDSQRDYLFGPGTTEIGSAALVPLGPDASYGVLAIGSHDRERFTPSMSTEYLARIGELVSAAVGEL
jgi:uncharacterized protein YigA (DUF484 family)